MATELATGYVSILPSTRGFTAALTQGISGSVRASAKTGGDAGSSFGAKFTSGARGVIGTLGSGVVSLVGTGLRGLAGVVGGAVRAVGTVAKVGAAGVAAVVAGALYKGYGRLTTIQDSTKSLTIALGSSTAAASLLGKTLTVVEGTPFPLDQFANATQQLVTMGVAADKVPGYLTAIGDAAATKGSQANEFAQRLAEQFGQIQSQGRITGTDILQMSQTGVNALAILQNHYGLTASEMQKMIAKGAVPATEALDVLTKGIEKGSDGIAGATPKLGGLAKTLGTTVSGAVANLGAAYARMGATIQQPLFDKLGPLVQTVSRAFDVLGKALGAVVQRFVDSAAFGQGYLRFIAFVRDKTPVAAMYIVAFAEKVGTFAGRLKDLFVQAKNSSVFQSFMDKLRGFSLGDVVSKVRDFAARLGELFDKVRSSPQFQTLLDKLRNFSLSGGISSLGTVLKDRIIPALKDFKPAPLIQFIKNLASAGKTSGKGVLIAAVTGLPAFITLVNTLTSLVAKVPPNVLVAIFAAVAGFKLAKGAANGVNSIADGITHIKDASGAFGTAKANISSFVGTISTIKTTGINKLKSGLETVGIKGMYAKERVDGFIVKMRTASNVAANWAKRGLTAVKDKVADVGKALVSSAASAGRWAKQGLVAAANWVKATAAAVANKAAQVAQAAATKIAAAAQVAFNIAMNANPVMLIVLGIAALVAGLVLAYNKVGWFRDFVNAVFNGIKTVVLGVVHFFQTNWSTISAVLTAPFRLAKTIATTVFNAIKAVVSGVIDWVTTNWSTISGILSAPIKLGVAAVKIAINAITTTFRAVKNAVGTIIGGIVGFVTGIPGRITGAVSRIAGIIKGPFTTAKNWVSDRVGDILGFFTDLPGKIRNGLSGLKNIITGAFKGALNGLLGIVNRAIGFINDKLIDNANKIPFVPDIPHIPTIPELHTGGLVPGGAANEPLYRLQGGEVVLSRAQAAAMRSSRNAPVERSVTGVHADKIIIEDPTTAEQFFRYAEMKMAMAAL